jgi:hypothetical protein
LCALNIVDIVERIILKCIISLGDWWGMWHVLGRGEMYTGFWWGSLRERYHLGDPALTGLT